MKLSEIPDQIRDFFTEEMPLGPVSAEAISDREVAAYVLSLENAACLELAHGASIVVGRKGAGKSSILNSFKLRRKLKSKSSLSIVRPKNHRQVQKGVDFEREYHIATYVNFSRIAGFVHERLGREPMQTPERSAEIWEEVLTELLLWETMRRPDLLEQIDGTLSKEIRALVGVFSGYLDDDYKPANIRKWASVEDVHIDRLVSIRERLRMAFRRQNFSVLFLIDSMEEYDRYDETLMKCVAGLLQLIATTAPPTRFKLALPGENFLRFRREGNLEKYALKTARINWRPIELLAVLTHRMLICLYLFENRLWQEQYLQYKVEGGDRKKLMSFWATIFGGDIQNEALQAEPGIYYLLRHSQLLPRQLINSMSKLINNSQTDLHSYGRISHSVVLRCMEDSCQALVSGVDSGFKDTYPNALASFERFLPKAPIVGKISDLHTVFNQSGIRVSVPEDYRENFTLYFDALVHMGVVGIVRGETEKYVEAQFDYLGIRRRDFDESDSYAMHPAFSLRYKTPVKRAELGKAVLPLGSIEDL